MSAERMSISVIARELDLDRKTVRSLLHLGPLLPTEHRHGSDTEAASHLRLGETGAEQLHSGQVMFPESGRVTMALRPSTNGVGQSPPRIITHLRNGQYTVVEPKICTELEAESTDTTNAPERELPW